MAAPTTIPSIQKKPHKPYNRKYNRTKVKALAEMGVKATDIAKAVDVDVSTITRYLKKIGMQAREIAHYRKHQADYMTMNRMKMSAISDMLAGAWLENPEVLLSQDLRLQKEILHTVNTVKTYDYNSERLERNQSTQNIDVYARVQEMEQELQAITKLEAQLGGKTKESEETA